jgi:phosphoglycerol transferase MdoB-like AlkP superfamily enzyme
MIPTEKIYFSLFKTSNPCIPRPFNDAGYDTVFAGSNTTVIDEEYAKLFPFQSFYARDDYDYQGPRMSWSYMPDQYIIDQMERRVLSKESAKPRFIYYKLSSSHHPWDTIPPFLADWSQVKDGAIYKEIKSKRYRDNAFLGGKHLNEGYYDSIVYSLETIFSYLNQMPEDREVLAVLFGDHQPRGPVADMDSDPWTIPLHIISRDAELVERFKTLDYTEGLFTTSKEALLPGLQDIAGQLFLILNDAKLARQEQHDETGQTRDQANAPEGD